MFDLSELYKKDNEFQNVFAFTVINYQNMSKNYYYFYYYYCGIVYFIEI